MTETTNGTNYTSIDDIKTALTDNFPVGLKISRTAWARMIGYSKLRPRVAAAIEELLEEGVVLYEEDPGGYDVYFLAPQGDSAEETSNESQSNDPVEDDCEVRTPVYTLPELTYGYEIVENKAGSRFPYTINCPDEKTVDLTYTERLLIINQDLNYRFVVSSPEEILSSIYTYTKEQALPSVTITQLGSSKAVKEPTEFNNDIILFVECVRHNKAGI